MSTTTHEEVTRPAPGAGFTANEVSAAGFRLAYWEAGQGEAVLYLHGAGGYQPTYALDLLAERFRIVAVQLPGWGDQPNDAANFDELADQVGALAAAIGLDRYHVIGTSFGGACALHLAVRHPESIISMVLEAPAKFREASVVPSELGPEAFVKAFRKHPERLPHLAPPDPAVMERVWPTVMRLMGPPDHDEVLASALASSRLRTLVLFGVDDGVINPINGRTIRRLMVNSTFQLVYDAAHEIQCDRPEAFADIVGDFLVRGMGFMLNETDGLLNP